jgi:hypothetical protein
MRTAPLSVAGLAGPVVLESFFFAGQYTVTVGGRTATRIGRGRYALPTAGGATVEARVRRAFFDIWPSLEINGVRHPTGPPTPVELRVLAWLPLLLVCCGGPVGGLIGALAVPVNLAVARLVAPTRGKLLMMIGVSAAAVMVMFAVLEGLDRAFGQ